MLCFRITHILVPDYQGMKLPTRWTSILITIYEERGKRYAPDAGKARQFSKETSGKQFSYRGVISGRLSHGL